MLRSEEQRCTPGAGSSQLPGAEGAEAHPHSAVDQHARCIVNPIAGMMQVLPCIGIHKGPAQPRHIPSHCKIPFKTNIKVPGNTAALRCAPSNTAHVYVTCNSAAQPTARRSIAASACAERQLVQRVPVQYTNGTGTRTAHGALRAWQREAQLPSPGIPCPLYRTHLAQVEPAPHPPDQARGSGRGRRRARPGQHTVQIAGMQLLRCGVYACTVVQ